MTTVRKLMVDIEKKAVTKEEFTILIREIIDRSELKVRVFNIILDN